MEMCLFVTIVMYLELEEKNMQISMMKNVPIITYDTSTKNISFIAGFESTTNVTEIYKKERR